MIRFCSISPEEFQANGTLCVDPALPNTQVAPVVVGKPNPLLIHQLMDQNGLTASSTLMVGDRLDTDIMFGNGGGISTALVLTGVSEMSDVIGLEAGGEKTPTYLLEKLGDLLPAATEAAEAAAASPTVSKI